MNTLPNTKTREMLEAGRAPAWVKRLPSREDVLASRAHRSLFHFFRLSWKEIEPTQKLVLNWHLEAICDHVQAALEDWIRVQEDENYEQRIRDLLANVPPGSSKSRIVSVCAPAWMWLHWPSWRVACLSSNPTVALRDALWSRDLITSDWYQRLFEPDWTLRGDQAVKSNFWNTAGGWRISFGWFAKITGGRNDALVLDDPHDAEEVKSDTMRASVIERYDTAIVNRVTSTKSVRLIIGQRVHHEDLSNHLLQKGTVTHLCIPQEFEPDRLSDAPDISKDEYPSVTPIGWSDPRTQPGELLDPVRFPPSSLEEDKVDLGTYGFAGQHQQRPAPRSGGIWKRIWWSYWTPAGLDLPPVMEKQADGSLIACRQTVLPSEFEWSAQSWDMAFGGGETSSMVVGQVWALGGARGVQRFLLDQVRGQMDFLETQAAFRLLTTNWPAITRKLVENKANGPAIISSLKGEIAGIDAVEPEGDKVSRAQAEEGTIEAGRVFLPHPGLFTLSPEQMEWLASAHPLIHAMVARAKLALALEVERAAHKKSRTKPKIWVAAFVDEAAKFPNGSFKDVVDTASQVLNRIRKYIKIRDAQNQMPTETSSSYRTAR